MNTYFDHYSDEALKTKKRALKHAIREETMRRNAIKREADRKERRYRLQQEVETLAAYAGQLGVDEDQK